MQECAICREDRSSFAMKRQICGHVYCVECYKSISKTNFKTALVLTEDCEVCLASMYRMNECPFCKEIVGSPIESRSFDEIPAEEAYILLIKDILRRCLYHNATPVRNIDLSDTRNDLSKLEVVRLRSKCEYYNEFANYLWNIFSMDDERVQSAVCDVLCAYEMK